MKTEARARTIPDSFLEAIHSEIVNGTESLSAWLKYIESRNGTDTLFELETRIKGLRSFFDIQHLSLSESERSNIVQRSFEAEIQVARQAIQSCEGYASEMVKLGQPDRMEFETFIENQLRKDNVLDYHVSRILDQPTPLDSLARLMESLNDLRVLIDALKDSSRQDFQVFLSLGRCYQRELKNIRYVDMLLSQRFRVQYDRVESPPLSALLRSIPEDRLRRNVALAFLYINRLLKYLTLVSAELGRDRPLRITLIIFALLHEEMGCFADFLKSRFLKGRDAGHRLWHAAELVVYSLRMESQRALERELVSVAREENAPAVFSRVENSHGMLRNCFQSCAITLARTFDKEIDTKGLFPTMIDSLRKSQKLRQDLWNLRQDMKDLLEKKEGLALDRILERLTVFRETTLHLLMYRDLAEFEQFADALVTASNTMELRILLRKFVSFLETLVQEVSKRSVLQEAPGQPTPGQ